MFHTPAHKQVAAKPAFIAAPASKLAPAVADVQATRDELRAQQIQQATDRLSDVDEAQLNDQKVHLASLRFSAARLKTRKARVLALIKEGEINADDTILIERAASACDWLAIAKGSIATLLSDSGYREQHGLDKVTVAWFAKHGIVA